MRAILTPPAPVKISACRSCGQNIVWAVWHSSGRKMPVDASRDPGGDLILYTESFDSRGEPREPYKCKRAEPEERELLGNTLWVSHFATCPHAAAHRQQKSTDASNKTPSR